MTKRNNYVGPCATACKPGAGTGKVSTVFGSIIVSATEHAAREAGLPGRADRMIVCRSCGTPTASGDGICRDCADAMRAERSEAIGALCRHHGVRFAEDLPAPAMRRFREEWGRC